MDEDRYNPVPHDDAFVARVLSNPEVRIAYDALEEEYSAISAFLHARKAAGLTQEEIASRMGTTKSAISRLESSLGNGRMSPSLATLRRYAAAVGCRLELKLMPL
ncbi:MAG: helix-turn-helix transcriptional regulator [Magnetococcales bacterium]|nr:helix-turn-helix transcriptional regulator [Magnetococcales bacterium]MBF0156355.1 helix-turn-helix transcriptional regulator [Magnetococcales bacterium]